MNLAEFLLARIAEDEAVARAASGGLDFNWGDYGINPELLADARFFERFGSPARILAECEAKRRIVKGCDAYYGDDLVAYVVLRLLALPYVDHPDYDQAWRP